MVAGVGVASGGGGGGGSIETPRPSVIKENEEFYQRHKAELDNTAASLRLSGTSFLCLAAAGLLQQAWAAGGGLFLPTSNLDQLAFGCFLLHAGALRPHIPRLSPLTAVCDRVADHRDQAEQSDQRADDARGGRGGLRGAGRGR